MIEGTDRIEVPDPDLLLRLTGPASALLQELSLQSGAVVSLRGHTIVVGGETAERSLALRFLSGAQTLLHEGHDLRTADIGPAVRALRKDPGQELSQLLDQVILVTTRHRPVVPKTPAQRLYVRAIREHDLTFGIGPAGTGKTYLAMAMAASFLITRRVKRIVLTRPAVEAGERLGFLPGDLAEKVNPYLRPLYDALNDMLDGEQVQKLRSRGVARRALMILTTSPSSV